MVKLGHASISEKGTINGNAGDQTGGEVTTRDYYDKMWTYVYTPKDSKLAESLVSSMKYACDNNNIGYGQNDRLTLYYECLRISTYGRITPDTIRLVSKKVNCDCSSLVALCCIASGLNVNPGITTWSEYCALDATRSFDIKPCNTLKLPNDLHYGDIIQSAGHTAIIIETDNYYYPTSKVTASKPAYTYDSKIAGTYRVTVNDFLALRDGGDTKYKMLYRLCNGDIVYCYGFRTNDFYYIQFVTNNTIYTGFAHREYLKRV